MSCGKLPNFIAGRMRDLDRWFLYTAFFDTGDYGVVKVGISRIPFKRLGQVHSGCPFPLEAAQFVAVGSGVIARRIERALQTSWTGRRLRGEWYRFDFADPHAKQAFHRGTRDCYAAHVGRLLEWTKVDVEKVIESVSQPTYDRNSYRQRTVSR